MEIMMARTEALNREQVSAESKPTLDAFTRNIGFTPNMTATFALSLTNRIRLQIAEKSAGSFNFLALLRWALVIIFLWFGAWKFTADEAARVSRYIEPSPIVGWLHALFGVQGASDVLGAIELSTAAALILGAFRPIFS